MSYSYEKEKANLFTESGAATLLAVRDEAQRLIATAGACTAEKAMQKASGSSWTMLAALDYMVERGELRRVTAQGETWGQHQVFVAGRR
jgi:hypothetical protein